MKPNKQTITCRVGEYGKVISVYEDERGAGIVLVEYKGDELPTYKPPFTVPDGHEPGFLTMSFWDMQGTCVIHAGYLHVADTVGRGKEAFNREIANRLDMRLAIEQNDTGIPFY